MKRSQLSSDEYNPYYQVYINEVSDESLVNVLDHGGKQTAEFFKAIPASKHEFRYEEGKWTPKEILLHLIDTERVFAYRALQFARSENAVIKGYDQDEFAAHSNANDRSLEDLISEYEIVRAATLVQFKSYTEEVMKRKGEASNAPLSARAAGFIIGGHEIHHCKVISERYL